jgi:hypothetical protein
MAEMSLLQEQKATLCRTINPTTIVGQANVSGEKSSKTMLLR